MRYHHHSRIYLLSAFSRRQLLLLFDSEISTFEKSDVVAWNLLAAGFSRILFNDRSIVRGIAWGLCTRAQSASHDPAHSWIVLSLLTRTLILAHAYTMRVCVCVFVCIYVAIYPYLRVRVIFTIGNHTMVVTSRLTHSLRIPYYSVCTSTISSSFSSFLLPLTHSALSASIKSMHQPS